MKRKNILLLCVTSMIMAVTGCGGTTSVSAAAETTREQVTYPTTYERKLYGKSMKTSDNASYIIDNFNIIYQNPELPTGCEITAMTMVLNYYGYNVDKVTMASEYLPCTSADLYYGDDGCLYGNDMNNYFIGNPFSTSGVICGTGAIVTAANDLLSDWGSRMQAMDITGASPEELFALVSQDIPVVVWATINMEERGSTEGWYTENGVYVDWSSNDHGVVLIGYSDSTVTIADPISGEVTYDRNIFEDIFASRNNQCVILQ